MVKKGVVSYVAYYRVSTTKQKVSGLGLQAQKESVERFVTEREGKLRASFTETESGKKNDRPKLLEALKLCKLTNSGLLVAKLDRLSRNLAFLATLQESKTRFIAVDMPDANETMIGFMAVMAQAERKMIVDRTKAALAVAKARGKKLGNKATLKPGNAKTSWKASVANAVKARERANELKTVIEDAREQGCTTLQSIADHLNNLGIQPPRQKGWYPTSVKNVLVLIGRAS